MMWVLGEHAGENQPGGADTGQGDALTEREGSLQGRHGSVLQAEQGQKEQGLPGPPGETRSSGLARVASVSSHL